MKGGVRRGGVLAVGALVLALLPFVPLSSGGTAAAAAVPAAAEASAPSAEPAPPSREKRVIGAVHTDTVSVFVDDGVLTLDSRADVDVTGDGVVDLGARLAAEETLFHLAPAARTEVPDLPAYGFLGEPGAPIWMAPQTQDHALIWPGFSTEDASLVGRVDGAVSLRLVGASGPGAVELYLQNGSTVQRTFSSRAQLPAWTIGVPQHTHMNWVFTAEGTHTLTFEATATVDGRVQTATADYVFVVGEQEAHRTETATTLRAAQDQVPAGQPVRVTAEVAPAAAVGAVQFRDPATGLVRGSAPLVDGVAVFESETLPPGIHRFAAEFVPTWSTDFTASASGEVSVRVEGEVRPRPEADDTAPVTEAEFAAVPAGERVHATADTVRAGGALEVAVPDGAGHWVSVWVPELAPAWRGWVQADLEGRVRIEVPADAKAGPFRVAVRDEEGALVGWDRFTVTATDTTPVPPTPQPPVPPAPQPVAPVQQCTPGLVLDSGHIDAFTVSAGAGRAVLQIKEDVTGRGVLHEVESVLLRVKPSAYRSDIPAGTPGAPAGFVLPLAQNPQLIWPGWDTNRTAASGFSDVTIVISAVDGPGRVHLSSQGSFGDTVPLLQGGGYRLPGSLREPTPAHTHAQWVFEREGIYRLHVHAVATNPSSGQSLRTAAHTYVFQVGDVPLGDAFCGLSSAGAGDAEAVARAVDDAAAQAVAAAQAAAAAEAVPSDEREGTGRDAQDDEGAAVAASGGTPFGPVQIALVAGGVLMVGGVIGITVWYLRRLRADAAVLVGDTPAAHTAAPTGRAASEAGATEA